jgi:hypothetical protein
MKTIKSLILSAALISTVALQAPRSEAMVALAFIPGSVFMVPVIIGTAFSVAPFMSGDFSFQSGALAIGGIIVFDKNANELEYKTITDEKAQKLGLSAVEMRAYNSELNRINLGLSEMNSTLSNTRKEDLESVRQEVLDNFKSEISTEAFSAVEKITKTAFAK